MIRVGGSPCGQGGGYRTSSPYAGHFEGKETPILLLYLVCPAQPEQRTNFKWSINFKNSA
jgi:hypothetical protein